MIELKEITPNNWWSIQKLNPGDVGAKFVASNQMSLAEAYVNLSTGKSVQTYGIYNGNEPVGFVMYTFYKHEELSEVAKQAIQDDNYYLWRFMIDAKFQGKGYGREALKQIMAEIKEQPLGKSNILTLSTDPENSHGISLYESLGFRRTGVLEDGEEILVVEL